jgi:hypothetical protein
LINYTRPVFYTAPALWDSFPNIVLLKDTDYHRYLSFLEKKVGESDPEGTIDKKNMTPSIQTHLSSSFFISLWICTENEKRK